MIRTTNSRQRKFIQDINITPFTDVCLVLLIIVMITAPAITADKGLMIKLPRAETANVSLDTSVTVRITSEQDIFVNNEPATFATLGGILKERHDQYGARLLVVKADERVPYQLVIETIDVARSVGVDKVALAARQNQPGR